MMNNNVVLQVENLTKIYKNRVAVDNLNFSIHKGEIFGFLGSNGAGKSTTMKMICGHANISSGTIKVCGYDAVKNPAKVLENIGGMIETPSFYPYLTGYQNLKFFGSLNKNFSKSKIMEIAEVVGLKERINDKVKNYSLGMKQRLGIAQSLLNDPKLLVLDEPTNGLDANGIREIKTFLKKLAKNGTAIMISSHILGIMEELCDTICIINKGKIIKTQNISDIKKSYNKQASHFIKTNKPNFAGKIIQRVFGIKVGVTSSKVVLNVNEDQLAKIIVELTNYKVPIFGAGEIQYSLEDMFIDIVGNEDGVK